MWHSLLTLVAQNAEPKCLASFCVSTGYHDDWQLMATARQSKTYLSLCVTIQFLKLIKFTSSLVPKMGLAPLVLKKALPVQSSEHPPPEPSELPLPLTTPVSPPPCLITAPVSVPRSVAPASLQRRTPVARPSLDRT